MLKRELKQKHISNKSHISLWKKGIVFLLIIQALVNIQNYQTHRLMWNSIHDTSLHLNQMLQIQNDYQDKVNQMLEQILHYLKAD